MQNDNAIRAGGCLCGSVRYQVTGKLRDVVNCHCTMCQRQHGIFGAHSKVRNSKLTITRGDGLGWYQSSKTARRGFCRECGTGLFWERSDQDATAIVAGTLDVPTGLRTVGHIFVAEKPDFYEIGDDLPQFDDSPNGELVDDY